MEKDAIVVDKDREYQALVEVVANARILVAHSGNRVVSDVAEEVKRMGVLAAETYGKSEREFTDDTVGLYLRYNFGLSEKRKEFVGELLEDLGGQVMPGEYYSYDKEQYEDYLKEAEALFDTEYKKFTE